MLQLFSVSFSNLFTPLALLFLNNLCFYRKKIFQILSYFILRHLYSHHMYLLSAVKVTCRLAALRSIIQDHILPNSSTGKREFRVVSIVQEDALPFHSSEAVAGTQLSFSALQKCKGGSVASDAKEMEMSWQCNVDLAVACVAVC